MLSRPELFGAATSGHHVPLLFGSYPETGFEEINGDLPQADLWPGVCQS